MKIGFISLGCDKNRVDSEKVLAMLVKKGYTITNKAEDADAIIINTCAFIRDAKVESIDAILEMVDLKKKNKDLKIIVIGCLAERYSEEVKFEIPDVDVVLGLGTYDEIENVLEGINSSDIYISSDKEEKYCIERVQTTPHYYAYLKIADGCNNFCSYCAIPKIRGRYRSYPMEHLLEEAKLLIKNGVKELIVVAQDTTRYGIDLYSKKRLVELLKELCKLDFYKIRLLYAYPELVDDELIDLIANEEKMAKYIDIPLQHINDEILKKMNRRISSKTIYKLLDKIRKANPNIVIRSSFIVGFPGETKDQFLELKRFIKAGYIAYAGFFAYSQEEDTVAAKLRDQIDQKTKQKRVEQLTKIQSKVIIRNHKKYKNTSQKVIYEGIDYELDAFYGRNEFNAPDVDTKVFFIADKPLNVGEIYDVNILRPDFHLVGAVQEDS